MENDQLMLQGVGQLQSIAERNHKFTIVLHVYKLANSVSETEMICLNCDVVDSNLKKSLRSLRKQLDNIANVYLQFSAVYSGLSCFFNGLTAEDPKFILHVKGQLQNMRPIQVE